MNECCFYVCVRLCIYIVNYWESKREKRASQTTRKYAIQENGAYTYIHVYTFTLMHILDSKGFSQWKTMDSTRTLGPLFKTKTKAKQRDLWQHAIKRLNDFYIHLDRAQVSKLMVYSVHRKERTTHSHNI